MAPVAPRLKILSVGGNAVSAFLSWRLQATNACDVTLVWKSGFESVYQYGISFKSATFGNERFKPRHVVRTPEEAAQNKGGAYDYVIVCIKALPDIYDIAAVIDSVVTPQHTCILVNTTHTLGVEATIEERFPTNVVLSLVSNAEISQLGTSEFEHSGSTEIWVGPANKNNNIPLAIQEDMAQALAMTLSTGQVDCKVSKNIRQQQFERVIGPIAFHPASVIFETPSHATLLEKPGVRQMVSDVIDELITLAGAEGCTLSTDFKDRTIKDLSQPSETASIMWQDYIARRPMEVETFLGSPIKLAEKLGLKLPRIETLYAIFHNINAVNQTRSKEINGLPPAPVSPSSSSPMPRISSGGPPRPMPNGNGMPRPRPRTSSNFGPPPSMRRLPANGGPPNGQRPSMNGAPNGYHPPKQPSRRGSFEDNDLGEFSHLVVYDEADGANGGGYPGEISDVALREREIQVRQRELDLKEQELRMRRGGYGGPGPRRRAPPPMRNGAGMYDDEDEDDDYFDTSGGPVVPMIDPDNFDMMSVTSRKNRSKPPPNKGDIRSNHLNGRENGISSRGNRFRPSFGRNRSSQIMNSIPSLHENILDDPLMGYSSNRYGDVDRGQLHAGSRSNSLTTSHLQEFQNGPGMNGAYPRRVSQSPGNPYTPSMRGGNGRPSPPNGMQQPIPRYPPGHGNTVAPQQVEQRVGVSTLQPPNVKPMRSLTGSASASAGSGDSTNLGSEPSAHSSQSSLGPRPPLGTR
ncbi:ketopantoate reductase PanE/ApbA-domain-containing protein [Ustulina deusta]|nr:ketopantoate reductase PanE/ApbA-domain-containing protein [Ustulina deusta]KAI3340896.1 ketopantoate reductase PanE/ApbA-domain-containing protein [Ustulina deusta]